MADTPSIYELEQIQDLPDVRRGDHEIGRLYMEEGDYVGIRTRGGDYIALDEEDLGPYGQRVEIDGSEGWEPIHTWWQKRQRAERDAHEALMVRRARANAAVEPTLTAIDLTESTREGTRRDHPEIREDATYLAKIGGETYIGFFAPQHYGWSFRCGYGVSGGRQFDPPGTNYSNWEGLWRLAMPPQLETEICEVEGIGYTVTRGPDGSTVNTPCSCFGIASRTHDNVDCPWLAKARSAEGD